MTSVFSSVICYYELSGQFVVVRNSHNTLDPDGEWSIPTEKIHPSYSAIRSTAKLVYDELGADPGRLVFLGYRDVLAAENGQSQHVILDFITPIIRSQVVNANPKKNYDVAWTNLDEIPKPCHDQLSVYLARYRQRLEASGVR